MIELSPINFTAEGLGVSVKAKVEKKLTKINRRLAKLGAPAATVEYGPVVTRSERDSITGIEMHWDEFEFVTVHGFEARHSGWRPIASLDHTYFSTDEAVASLFPGAIEDEIALPESFRFRGPVCDHCGIKINRNLTIVFLHDDGRWIEVGTSCVLDFIGVDPATILWLSNSVNDMFDTDDDEFAGGRDDLFLTPATFLAVAAAVTEIVGFVPTSADGLSNRDLTVDIAYGNMKPSVVAKDFPDLDVEAGKAIAANIIDWVMSDAAGSGDFIASARVALRADKVGPRTHGLIAALPFVFKKATTEATLAEAATPSEFVGTVGEKITVVGEVITSLTVETHFGASKRITVRTAAGELLTTFGSGKTLWAPNVGDTVSWTGKISGHEDHPKYGKQTSCKMVKLTALDEDGNPAPVFARWCDTCANPILAKPGEKPASQCPACIAEGRVA